MTDDNRRCTNVSHTKATTHDNQDEEHGIFDPRSTRLVEPVFQMTEADWSKYGNSTSERSDKDVYHGAFYGYGFPSGPVNMNSARSSASPTENGKVPQRYREASDSEWDAYERRNREATIAVEGERDNRHVSHNALHKRFSVRCILYAKFCFQFR